MPKTQNSIVPVKKGKTLVPRGSGQLPFPREQLRQELMEAAGLDQKEKERIFKKLLNQLDKALTAKRTLISSYKGEIIDERKVEDWDARLTAIRQGMDLLDVIRGKNEGGSSAPVTFIINAPDWEQPEPAKIINAEGTEVKEET